METGREMQDMKQEKQWIKQIKNKSSPDAANALISKYYKEIFAYVYKQTMNRELAMDLTQEIFISVLQSIHNFRGEKASFRTWLYRIATNRTVDYFRSKYYKYERMASSIEDVELQDHRQDFTLRIEYKQDVQAIMNIVNQLETTSQQIFRLKLFAEYTFVDIASILQLPESTVKTRYYTTIRKIRKILEEVESNGS